MKDYLQLLLLAVAFSFTACNQCMECEEKEGYGSDGEEGPYIEVCKDNFDSRNDYEDYIEMLEEEDRYDCKSDFWN